MILAGNFGVTLRNFEVGDATGLVKHGDNPNVSKYLRARFPSPYTIDDSLAWISLRSNDKSPFAHFVIDVKGEGACGGIGLDLEEGEDISSRVAEIGYWVGEQLAGRGIVTEALRLFERYVWNNFNPERLNTLRAIIFSDNTASKRVLTKCDFQLCGILPSYYFKFGNYWEASLYIKTRPLHEDPPIFLPSSTTSTTSSSSSSPDSSLSATSSFLRIGDEDVFTLPYLCFDESRYDLLLANKVQIALQMLSEVVEYPLSQATIIDSPKRYFRLRSRFAIHHYLNDQQQPCLDYIIWDGLTSSVAIDSFPHASITICQVKLVLLRKIELLQGQLIKNLKVVISFFVYKCSIILTFF